MQLEEEIQDAGEMDLDTKDTDYKVPLDKLELEDEEEEELVLQTNRTSVDNRDSDGHCSHPGLPIQVAKGDRSETSFDREILSEVTKDVKQVEEMPDKSTDLGPVEVSRKFDYYSVMLESDDVTQFLPVI